MEEKKVDEVEKSTQENATKGSTQKKAESSDEEVDDELDLETQAMSYGNIKEKKDITTNEKQEESENKGYGFDTSAAVVPSGKTSDIKREKKDASEITFGGTRPKFARKVNKGQFGAEFSEGLDDIDDDGNIKNKPRKEFSRADGGGGGGQREFVNLGSKARVDRPEDFKRDEPMMKTTGIKPTFRGKLNLNKGGATEEDGDYGVKTNYGFAVSYKTDQPGFITDGKDRKPREKGVPFEEHMAKKVEEDDEFQIVREKERKPRVFNNNNSDDEEQNPSDGTKITRGDARGDARGGRGGFGDRGGRGGFFKNSAKREE